MTRYDTIQYDAIQHDTTWYMIWYDTTRHDTTRHDTTRHNAIWRDTTLLSGYAEIPFKSSDTYDIHHTSTLNSHDYKNYHIIIDPGLTELHNDVGWATG